MEISTLDAAAVHRTLLRQSPKQDFGELRLLGEGWDGIVYLAGDETVLRFPKSSNAARALETEVRLLPAIVPLFERDERRAFIEWSGTLLPVRGRSPLVRR